MTLSGNTLGQNSWGVGSHSGTRAKWGHNHPNSSQMQSKAAPPHFLSLWDGRRGSYKCVKKSISQEAGCDLLGFCYPCFVCFLVVGIGHNNFTPIKHYTTELGPSSISLGGRGAIMTSEIFRLSTSLLLHSWDPGPWTRKARLQQFPEVFINKKKPGIVTHMPANLSTWGVGRARGDYNKRRLNINVYL